MLNDFLRLFGRRLYAPEKGGEPADDAADAAADDADDAVDDNAAADDADDTADDADAADDADDTADDDSADGADDADDTQRSRKETRVSRLANEAREERDRRIALETENRLLRENGTTKPTNDEAKRLREERLSLMEPAERKAFVQEEELAELRRGQQMTQIQLADMADRSAYDSKAQGNSIYAKHKDWVENTLRAERAAGRNPSRELLLRVKIGEEALKPRSKKQSTAEKAAAAERVRKAKGKTLSARGDAGSSRKDDDSVEALRQRILSREARGDM